MAVRFGLFALLWVVLDGAKPLGLGIGLPVAFLAAWMSVRLLPPGGMHLRLGALVRLVVRLLHDSIRAGWDVALRAFHPRLPLRPGFVTVPCGIPEGARRDLLMALGGLQPGSFPVGETPDGEIVLHCLDTSQFVAAQMAAQEELLQRALGGPRRP